MHNCSSQLCIISNIKVYCKNIFIITIELRVQFSKHTYTGYERSGMIPVTLMLRGGILLNKISMTVIPSDQSPASAEGNNLSCHDYYLSSLLLTGNGVDYISIPINATIAAGATSTTINVPITKDNITEQSETFDLTFIIPPSLRSQVIPKRITKAIGVITDDTSKIV